MRVISGIAELRKLLAAERASGNRIGVVPTMGALHQGHLSLVRLAVEHSDLVVLSIFVNPTQFNSSADLAAYPRVLEHDVALAQAAGVDVVFAPSESEMYPQVVLIGDTPPTLNAVQSARIRAGSVAEGLCGASRPGHFDGVVTVVGMLFHIVEPSVAVFGEKDYQQLQVIRQMVRELHFPVEIISGPTVRDNDGLALSSRNIRLTAEERFQALYIPQTLFKAAEMCRHGEAEVEKLLLVAKENIEKSRGLRLDYLEIRHTDTLELIQGEILDHAQMLIAAFAGEVRLIDNLRLERATGSS